MTEVTNAKVSSEVVGALVKAVPGIEGTYVDSTTGDFVLQTSRDLTPAEKATVSDALGPVSVRFARSEKMADTSIVRGGTAMSGCTAAYTATYNSYIGVLTAAHCGSMDLYTGPTGGTAMAGIVRTSVHNANADIEFMSVSGANSLYTTFYGPSTTTPTQNKTEQDVGEGTTACRRGKSSGYDCGTITNIAYRPTYSGACPNATCNAVFVLVNIGTIGGDSGGPWWVGNGFIIGVHKGGSSSESIYSKIYRKPSGTTIHYQ